MNKEEIRQLKKQNDSLKQKLNWIAFGDDPELALRYLRKIGYVDFDEERKVYINKHNNEPFFLKDEQEKDYYIKDNELNEYTEKLEYQIKELNKQLTTYQILRRDWRVDNLKNIRKIEEMENQQKEFIEYLTSYIDLLSNKPDSIEENQKDILEEILSKYKSIICSDINVGSKGDKI